MARVLAAQYAAAGSGTAVLTAYMASAMQGECSSPAGDDTFAVDAYTDPRKVYLKTPIKPVIAKFGVETILIYIAVLLKKRIAVLCSDVNELHTLVRTFPQFVYKRQDWSIIRPNVGTTNDEIADLVAVGSSYIAGFTDPSITIREDLYDLIVDVNGGSVTYASHAADTFAMGKVHKEIAMYMVEAAGDEEVSEKEVLKALMAKTDMLMDGLNKLASPSEEDEERLVVTVEAIRARKMPKAMHQFLYNLAVAEDMVDQ
jgi:hypothetical protein